jgi:hypothetical protein
MLWPFVVAIVVFAFAGLKTFQARARQPINLGTLRAHMERYETLCRAIAAERARMTGLQGDEQAAAAARLDAMEAHRVKAEALALALRERLVKGGFGMGTAQLFTVADAEREMAAKATPKP